MVGYQKLKRQMLPLLKGIPFIIGVFLLSLFIAKKIIDYTPNTYQSIAKIKLDDQKYGFSNNNLFNDFDVFSTENKIEAEAEILQSPLIVEKALKNLDFEVAIYRVGSLKNTMLYKNSPIQINYVADRIEFYDVNYELTINDKKITIKDANQSIFQGTLGKDIQINDGTVNIQKNENLLNESYQLSGNYQFKIFSKSELISDVRSRLNITAVDKEIAVLRVVYTDQHPEKVADLVNSLCDAYINDYVETKSYAAKQTEEFIDVKLQEVGNQLSNAEDDIESFKIEKHVVNTLQETETGLREISKLNVSLINLEMNEKAVLELKKYLDSGVYFDETAIAFGFGDLLMTELVKNMKNRQDEKKDLLLLYQPNHEKVKIIDEKIAEIKKYIISAINQNLSEINTKKNEIKEVLEYESKMFDSLPSREKKNNVLERNFHILENVYNFLSQKRIEASIASSAMHSFHRVIEEGKIPKEPISPNSTLIKFIFGLLGLILSISIVYLRSLLRAKVKTKEDIELNTNLNLAGLIRKNQINTDVSNVALSLLMKGKLPEAGIISICSTLHGEGRSTFASAFKNELEKHFNHVDLITYDELSEMNLTQLYEEYNLEKQIVVVDCPPISSEIKGVHFMKNSALTIYLLRYDYTPISLINHAELVTKEYELENVHLVLNNAHKALNYSGSLIGSSFNSNFSKNVYQRIIGYIKTYVLN